MERSGMKAATLVLVLVVGITCACAQDCYFDFEDNSELSNFKQDCDGTKGSWSISDKDLFESVTPADFPTGDRLLTVAAGQKACLITQKKMTVLMKNPTVTVYFVWKGPMFGNTGFNIVLECDTGDVSTSKVLWQVLDGIDVTIDGQWYKRQKQITVPTDSCKVQIDLYRNSQDIGIDRIEIDGVNSEECYVVPKPTEPTAPTEPTTDEPPTTPDTPEPTTDEPSTTPEPTTDEPSTTPDTPEPTTDEPSTTPDTPEPTTDEPSTTPDTPEPTTDEPSTTSNTPEPTTDEPPTTPATPEPTTDEPSTPEATSSTNLPPTTVGGDTSGSSPGFSSLYIVIIIAAAGALVALAVFTYFCVIIFRRNLRQRRNPVYTRRKPFMPQKIYII